MQVEPIEGGETRYRESWTPNLEGQSCLAGGQKTSNLEHFRNQSPYPSALFTSVVYRTGQDSKPKLPTSGSPTILPEPPSGSVARLDPDAIVNC
jgi:hypothetical protein